MNNFFNFDGIKEHIDFINEEKSKSFVKWIYSLSPYEFTAVAAIIGLTLAPNLTLSEQLAVGNFLIEIGQVLLTVNSRLSLNEANKALNISQANEMSNQMKNEFNKKLAILQKQINNLKVPPV